MLRFRPSAPAVGIGLEAGRLNLQRAVLRQLSIDDAGNLC